MRGAAWLMSNIRSCPPGIGKPWSSGGLRKPSLVWKLTSTTAEAGNGLNTASNSRASRVVVPVGRYHALDADDAHAVSDAVLRYVASLGGSISAEHGVGRAKTQWLALSRSPAELAAMWSIKAALDPDGRLNPGVIFDG